MKKTRFIPYGYTIRDGKTVIDHTEAEVIRLIFEDYINGASLKDIAQDLTAKHIPYTEKTTEWDKARISRIIENTKYLGSNEYDPIIDEETYEIAIAAKAARQRNTTQNESEGIKAIRDHVICAKCGYPMVRRICSKRHIKESWTCTNDECGIRLRISDGELLTKVNLMMNRIIENTELLIPTPKLKTTDSPAVEAIQRDIDTELTNHHPSEERIVDKLCDMASLMYRETQAKEMIIAQIARKRAMMMHPQESFNSEYFSDLIVCILIDNTGEITLRTKVNTEIKEGEENV